jgi:cytochrome c
MAQSIGAPMHRLLAAAVVVVIGHASAGAAEDGRAVYAQTCARCHGQISETQANGAARALPAVMAPLGPNLTGVFGRPAGSVAGFRYSNAMRAAAERGLVWDAETLDRFLADSQAMLRGSYMFLKLQQPQRGQVIDYLARRGRHPK